MEQRNKKIYYKYLNLPNFRIVIEHLFTVTDGHKKSLSSLNSRTILWTSKVPAIFGASSMSSGSSKTSHSGRYRNLIPLIVLSAYFANDSGSVICVFPDLTSRSSLLFPRHRLSDLFHDGARYSTMSLRISYQFGQSNQKHIGSETGPRIHHSKRKL